MDEQRDITPLDDLLQPAIKPTEVPLEAEENVSDPAEELDVEEAALHTDEPAAEEETTPPEESEQVFVPVDEPQEAFDPVDEAEETFAPIEESADSFVPAEEPQKAFLPIEEPQEWSHTPPRLSDEPQNQTDGLFSPINVRDIYENDPLQNADSLPTLFPQDEMVIEPEQPNVEPTVVPRPKRKKNRGRRIARRILISLFKWLFALVLAVAVLALGLVGYLTMTEYDPGYAEKAQTGSKLVTGAYDTGSTLRIVTFNTGYGGLGEDADFFMDGGEGVTPASKEVVKENMIGIERILSETDADILLLQEVDTDSKRSYEFNQWLQYEYDLEGYESCFALNYSCDFVPYPIGDFIGEVHSGLATYSRFDIRSATRYSLPCPFSWPTRVANLKRCLLMTRIPIEGREQELVIVNLHLEAYDDGEGKTAQMEQLMELLRTEYAKGNYVIAGGDFNQTFPNCDSYPLLDESYWQPGTLETLKYGWKYACDDSVPTCRLLNEPYDRKDAQYYVIDGFIVSPNVIIKQVRTLDEDFVYSDHNPVLLEVELK